MPSNVFSTMAARAKAHHESLNSAYATYYSGVSPSSSSSTENSRSSSIAAPQVSAAPRNPTNASKAWSALKKHHREMNEAYTVFYSPGISTTSSRANSAASSPRGSVEENDAKVQLAAVPQPERNGTKTWKALKARVVEHHQSVNAAFAQTYGVK